jgi:hypothetical protein
MREDTLIYFDTPSDLIAFLHELDVYNGWQIQSGLLNDRGKQIYNRRYVKMLRERFDNRDFFRQRVSIAEIVSWLDTMSLMRRLVESLRAKLGRDVAEQIHIYCEYMIQMSKKMRIDYVLEYEDRLLLLEFRTVNRFEKLRSTWQMKFQELQIYKELMSYYLPDKTIRVYSFIAMYEYDRGKLDVVQKQYNDNQVNYLTEYIQRYLVTKI